MGGGEKTNCSKQDDHDDTHHATTSAAIRRIVTQAKSNPHNAAAIAATSFFFMNLDVQSAGGAYCSGLARSDGSSSILNHRRGDSAQAAELKKSSFSPKEQQQQQQQQQQQHHRTTGEWIYSGDDNHHAHAEPPSWVGSSTECCSSTSSSAKEDSQQEHQTQPLWSGRNVFFQRTSKFVFARWRNKDKDKNKDKLSHYALEEESEFFQCQMPSKGVFNISSNHVLINEARTKRDIPALTRDFQMDDLARDIAHTLMKNILRDQKYTQHKYQYEEENMVLISGFNILQTCDLPNLVLPKLGRPFRRLGYNFAVGNTANAIHTHMLTGDISCKNNMLDRRFEYFGMGTATHHCCSSASSKKNKNDTELYMVQLYVS